ncbi:MAG TPA: hypothetical protein PK079_09000 [Leptospiraceae bacterium]|nr:hypothetical protein [Leptospiraceae bacterium]HMW06879.1 hypothetical protein [Leptospiraceae bacterium]HMX34563.1 hypothetical protein [Leptospiraceae bacterium]HMY32398.1 hypothetical protein [Leptospiraceae bacterium]HMZ65306.1 hypothetical protein [Leptospiraceae bacterium]
MYLRKAFRKISRIITYCLLLGIYSCSWTGSGADDYGNNINHWDERSLRGDKVINKIYSAIQVGIFLRISLCPTNSLNSNCNNTQLITYTTSYFLLKSKISDQSYYYIESVEKCERKILQGSFLVDPTYIFLSCQLIEQKYYGSKKRRNYILD